MGAYLLARGRNLSAPLSAMVAFVATLNGWIMCWGATDWFGALGAWTWLPWAWWGLERALDPRRGPWRFLWPAPFVYLLVTGGFPYTVGMLGLLTAWLALKSLVETKSFPRFCHWFSARSSGSVFPLRRGSHCLITSTAQRARRTRRPHIFNGWFRLRRCPRLSCRIGRSTGRIFLREAAPHTSAEMACGLVAPVALLAGLFRQRLSLVRRIKWDLALFLLVLIISMLPSANLFRWSFRWLPLVHLLLALCAAEALQLLELSPRRFFPRRKLGISNRCAHDRRDVAHSNRRSLCVAVCADPFLSRSSLGNNRFVAGKLPKSAKMDAAGDYLCCIPRNLSVSADECWCSEI